MRKEIALWTINVSLKCILIEVSISLSLHFAPLKRVRTIFHPICDYTTRCEDQESNADTFNCVQEILLNGKYGR